MFKNLPIDLVPGYRQSAILSGQISFPIFRIVGGETDQVDLIVWNDISFLVAVISIQIACPDSALDNVHTYSVDHLFSVSHQLLKVKFQVSSTCPQTLPKLSLTYIIAKWMFHFMLLFIKRSIHGIWLRTRLLDSITNYKVLKLSKKTHNSS